MHSRKLHRWVATIIDRSFAVIVHSRSRGDEIAYIYRIFVHTCVRRCVVARFDLASYIRCDVLGCDVRVNIGMYAVVGGHIVRGESAIALSCLSDVLMAACATT